MFNRYGPTETTVACCTYEVTEETDPNKPIPIGKPHKNVRFRAINEQGKEIGVNETGELFIGGVQVMDMLLEGSGTNRKGDFEVRRWEALL